MLSLQYLLRPARVAAQRFKPPACRTSRFGHQPTTSVTSLPWSLNRYHPRSPMF